MIGHIFVVHTYNVINCTGTLAQNQCTSEDVRTPDIETTFGIEQSNEGDETETSSLEETLTFQKPTEPPGGPIHVTDFHRYVTDLQRGRGMLLEVQFRVR